MPHAILFTGHMSDQPGRPTPRFPPAKEPAADAAIRHALVKVQAAAGSEGLKGIAAAACGGDILFHEACIQLGIPSEVYLGIPIDAFLQTSVAFAGRDWEDRYHRLTHQLPVHVLFPHLGADVSGEVWEQANDWMIQTALKAGRDNITLIALWDGDKGDGKGGASHMIKEVKAHDGKTEVIDVRALQQPR